MPASRAVQASLDLMRMPVWASALRRQPLPPDILQLIQIAAGIPEILTPAASAAQVTERALRCAATFYLQEMLFFPGADFHRNLGLERSATRAQMRLHMRWLLRWLHPDHNPEPGTTDLAKRVILAWRELGCRSAQSPSHSQSTTVQKQVSHGRLGRVPWIAVPIEKFESSAKRSVMQRIVFLAVLVIIAAILFVPDSLLLGWLASFGRSLPPKADVVSFDSIIAQKVHLLAQSHAGSGIKP